ncbi:uncharacterized protein LOC111322974 [Stylophora pistillata]|uniref:uncharacterized protein LOC111322974 n=1 Tax=Stylophora pistillata TaxID=50429 RepID=UPI000C04148C|nr:uncharacterized protein LOC111322974 [Stylophora pistillata]
MEITQEITHGVQSLKLEDISTGAMAYRDSKEVDFNTSSSESEEESPHAGRSNQGSNVIQPAKHHTLTNEREITQRFKSQELTNSSTSAKITSGQRESVACYGMWLIIYILFFLAGLIVNMWHMHIQHLQM